MRQKLAKRLPILSAIADDPATEPETKIRALEVLARYGLGPPKSDFPTDLVTELAGAVAEVFHGEQHTEALQELQARWVAIVQRRKGGR